MLRDEIRVPKHRKHARDAEEEGAGYGLYISQKIAKEHLGTSIKVEQITPTVSGKGYWTTFSLRVPDQAAIL